MADVTSDTTNSNLINAVGGTDSYTGERPPDFVDLHRQTGFILSMQRLDIFEVMEGQARPRGQAEETAQPQTPIYTWGYATATPERLRPCQPRPLCNPVLGDRQGSGSPGGNLCLRRARDSWRWQGNDAGIGIKYLWVINEAIRALQAALSATSTEPLIPTTTS